MSVNKVILVGRLGQNPEIRYTPSGAAVTNFSVATNESWTDKSGQKQERTEWLRIVTFSKLAEIAAEYAGKDLLLVGVLKGAVMVMADSMQRANSAEPVK